MLTSKDKELIAVLIQEVAGKLIVDVIDECFTYNAEARERPGKKHQEFHYRTGELMRRFIEARLDDLWMKYDTLEMDEDNRFVEVYDYDEHGNGLHRVADLQNWDE
jgi:hypothetical protein